MTEPKATAFQLRTEQNRHRVYLIRVDRRPVPASELVFVYDSASAYRAQLVCDVLNSGLLNRIAQAVALAVAAFAASDARARMERKT